MARNGQNNQEKIPWMIYSFAGAGSGFVTRAITQPLDVVKIRMQIQDKPTNFTGPIKYKSTWQATRKIMSEEGTKALWKGHVPAQVLSISYGVIQFSCFEVLTQMINPFTRSSSLLQPISNFVCGSIAGISATIFSYPFDVIRTRLIIQGHPKSYNSMHEAFKLILLKESPRGIYKGFLPTVVQIAPNTGFQFAFYRLSSSAWDSVRELLKPNFNSDSNNSTGVLKSLACGSIAGLGAKTIVYPLDFAKKRLQMKGFHIYGNSIIGSAQNYQGLWDCLVTVVRSEGFLALYKGLTPSMWKAVSTSALVFCSYEQFLKIFITANNTFNNS